MQAKSYALSNFGCYEDHIATFKVRQSEQRKQQQEMEKKFCGYATFGGHFDSHCDAQFVDSVTP